MRERGKSQEWSGQRGDSPKRPERGWRWVVGGGRRQSAGPAFWGCQCAPSVAKKGRVLSIVQARATSRVKAKLRTIAGTFPRVSFLSRALSLSLSLSCLTFEDRADHRHFSEAFRATDRDPSVFFL